MDISKVLVGGILYDIRDTVARAAAVGTIHLLGVTTTELSDKATVSSIVVNGDTVDVNENDAVFYGNKEYVFDGTNWHEFGDMSGLGAAASKDSLSCSYTPTGTNAASDVTFSNTQSGYFVTGIDNAAIAPSFTEGEFNAGTLPSLGAATTSTFATEGMVVEYVSATETLSITTANTANAVIAQGSFSAGTLPTKAADTFSAGSAATFTTAEAITDLGTATAAGQTFSGTTATITVT